MIILGLISLSFMVFEVGQLIVAQRFIGIEQIRGKIHPLDGPAPRSFWFSAGWVAALLTDYMFQATLLLLPNLNSMVDRSYLVRLAALLMLIASFVGFAVRRSCGIKLGLVVLTLEGAMRAGFFAFVFWYLVAWRGVWPGFYFYRFW